MVVEFVRDFPCDDDSGSGRTAIGALGEIRWSTPDRCALDLDVALFFLSESGEVGAAGLAANNLPVLDLGTSAWR